MPDTWKIDVPDSVDARKLYDNLLNHLTMVDDQQAQWPADENDAYRLVSHHVLMAIMDQQQQGSSGMSDDKTTTMPPARDMDRDRTNSGGATGGSTGGTSNNPR